MTSIYTLGHSSRPIEEFIDLLKRNQIVLVVDVRTIPRSRHNPQYEIHSLARSLRAARIGYRHLGELGGLRKPKKDSPNTGWRNASFRGYADYMQSPQFREGLSELIAAAATQTVAIVCAEAVPWRCHRSLIADALLARGIHVEHILSQSRNQPHRITPWAKVRDDTITYPGPLSAKHSAMPLLLYHSLDCPFSARVRMALAEKGVPYRGSIVDLTHIPERIDQLNPGGTVPILQDHGNVVYGSRAICEYLEERFPVPNLMPKTPFKRARVRMLWDFCDSEVIDASNKGLLRASKRIEAELDRSRYLVDKLSLADLAFAPFLLQAPEMIRRNFPGKVSVWLETLLHRPSIAEDSACPKAVVIGRSKSI